jgi:phosphocarrier protein
VSIARTPSRQVAIVNSKGLHARAAAKFAKLSNKFVSEVTVSKEDTSVSGRSIMGLMMLAAGRGSEITISARGTDADAAVLALARLVENGFDES